MDHTGEKMYIYKQHIDYQSVKNITKKMTPNWTKSIWNRLKSSVILQFS